MDAAARALLCGPLAAAWGGSRGGRWSSGRRTRAAASGAEGGARQRVSRGNQQEARALAGRWRQEERSGLALAGGKGAPTPRRVLARSRRAAGVALGRTLQRPDEVPAQVAVPAESRGNGASAGTPPDVSAAESCRGCLTEHLARRASPHSVRHRREVCAERQPLRRGPENTADEPTQHRPRVSLEGASSQAGIHYGLVLLIVLVVTVLTALSTHFAGQHFVISLSSVSASWRLLVQNEMRRAQERHRLSQAQRAQSTAPSSSGSACLEETASQVTRFDVTGLGECAYLNENSVSSGRVYSERKWICSKPNNYNG
ncbi:hypothetical protein J0S82_000316 [Galemys pyrenaicus]|uniref:Uncharacterized protein n=1 Tax=Galemys pyrenaicus TaxID=202257 RepID=A0A8J6DCF6_GALPY|nr:hypothetical protein J0S82_000316 [Galemys pyrenaicus]